MPVRRRRADLPRLWRSPFTQLAVPLALILVITVAALQMPENLHLGPLLVVAPALTASFAGPRTTAVVGAVAVAAQVVLRLVRDGLSPVESAIQVAALLLVSAFVVVYAAVRERRVRQLAEVRKVSEAAQRVVLRPLPSRIGSLRIASTYLAATAEAQIGGDLYAVARTGDGTRLIIGDVRGKGLATIGDAAVLLGAFREAAHVHAALPGLVTHLEESVGRNLAELAETDQDAREYFITAAVLNVPDDHSLVELIDCGHPPPLLLRGRSVVALQVGRPAPPLGLGELSGGGYEVDRFAFEPGDVLLLYTDGVIEARNAAGDFYPLVERVLSWPGLDPQALVQHVREDLLAYVGGRLGDDAALIAVERAHG